jgi:hypothetical protein
MKNGTIVMPKAINKETLTMHQATKYRFVVDTLQRMGLFDLMCLAPDDDCYCPILVRQFHSTVFFHDDPTRTMMWMTGPQKYTCNYLDFCEAMGFPGGRAHGFKIYSQNKFTKGDISFSILRNPQLVLPLSLACTNPTLYLPRYSMRISSASPEIQVNVVHTDDA